MTIWQYQSQTPWSREDGTLTDQSRLWLNALFKTVTTHGNGPVQLGGDLGGTNTAPLVIGLQGKPVSNIAPANQQVLTWVAADAKWEPKPVGTVTSVGLTMPAEFAVGGSPITTSGTLAVTKATQAPNQVYAGPTTGAAAAPAFRALAQADMPTGIAPQVNSDWNAASGVAQILNKPATVVTSVGLAMPAEFTVAGSPVTAAGTLTAAKATQAANTVYAGPSTGAAAAPTFRALTAADVPQVIKVNGTPVGV
jgi:hypothetical protein